MYNKYHIWVNECCASCVFATIDSDTKRKCEIDNEKYRPSFGCARWKMAKGFEEAGKGDGRIKKKAWLHFYLAFLHKENGLKVMDKTPREQAVEVWEKLHGSIYEENI